MADPSTLRIDDKWIRSLRGKKNYTDPDLPYAWSVEPERNMVGKVESTATVFLTNRECPFACLMCDLWKNTTDISIPAEQIVNQISGVMNHIDQARHLKLYNSGNFFDTKAIPENAYIPIAGLVKRFTTLIVESHPKLINDKSIKFKDLLEPELQVAIGLETSNPMVLSRLNKQMTLLDFHQATQFLSSHRIPVRAFILLRPPFLEEKEAVKWAKRSIDFAFDSGVECCVIIPTRGGNGALEILHEQGYFEQPEIESLEEVLEYGVGLKAGRVFADLWDIENFSHCNECLDARKKRIHEINLSQVISERIVCNCQVHR